MTTKQAAAYLGKEASTLRHLVREGKIESVKKGHFTVLDVLDVKQLKKWTKPFITPRQVMLF